MSHEEIFGANSVVNSGNRADIVVTEITNVYTQGTILFIINIYKSDQS